MKPLICSDSLHSALLRSVKSRFLTLGIVMFACIVSFGSLLTSCTTVYSTRADYFGYRNNLPVPPEQDFSQQQGNFNGSTTWANPMATGAVSSVAFVPVITPWYDSWSMFVRPSLRFRMMWGDPFWGGGFGWGNGFAGGFNDPFWGGGFGSSFMYYSCPWYNFNPYFGGYTPFGFYRPLGWWSSNNFTNVINNTIINNGGTGGVGTDPYNNAQLRAQGGQRAYSNVNATNNASYMGSYDGGGSGGGRSRADGNYYSAASNSMNKASQFNTSTYSSGSGAIYDNARYNGRSYGGYSSGSSSNSSSGWSSGGSNSSSGGGWGGGKSSGGYGGGSYGGSSGGSYGGSSSGGGNHSSGSSSGGGGGKSTGGYGGGGRR